MWRYCKDIANVLFWELWKCLTIPIKIIVSTFSKLTSSFTSFLRYCTEIATFLFWVIWACLAMIVSLWRNLWQLSAGKNQLHPVLFPWDIARILYKPVALRLCTCLAMHTQSDTINWKKISVFICSQKINFIPHAFLEILQRYILFWVF